MTARDDAGAARRDAVRAARAAQTPPGPAPDRFRVVSWNVNSLKARTPGVERFLARTTPDVVAFQETRAAALVPAAAEMFDRLGLHVAYTGSGTWNGVAIVSPHALHDVVASPDFGVEVLDRQARLIAAVVNTERSGLVRIVDVYAPHGREPGHDQYAFKLAFYEALTDVLAGWVASGPPVLLAGDLNVGPTDADVYHPDAFVGLTHVTAPEREALARLLDVGLVDLDAARWGANARRFTWWDIGLGYLRNLGMRIDLLAAEPALADRLVTTWIDHVARCDDRPSDHAPLIADFHEPLNRGIPAAAPATPADERPTRDSRPRQPDSGRSGNARRPCHRDVRNDRPTGHPASGTEQPSPADDHESDRRTQPEGRLPERPALRS